MKVLVEVGVGRAVEDWLRVQQHDVLAVRDRDARMLDLDILSLAVSEQRLLVTMDKDFGELVYHSEKPHSSRSPTRSCMAPAPCSTCKDAVE